jgi:hypothetical protein
MPSSKGIIRVEQFLKQPIKIAHLRLLCGSFTHEYTTCVELTGICLMVAAQRAALQRRRTSRSVER